MSSDCWSTPLSQVIVTPPPLFEIVGLPAGTDAETTVTLCAHVAVFPLPSVTVQITLFAPSA
jgi:hypothetical protein